MTLRAGVRFGFDEVRQAHVLLLPEGVEVLNDTAAAVVRTGGDLALLREEFEGVEPEDILPICTRLDVRPGPTEPEIIKGHPGNPDPMPFGLLAELTYRCPLHCPYCSNPLNLNATELDTDTWLRVLDQARALGVLQLHLSGGEPLARKDLPTLTGHARTLGLYTNLVTSGMGLSAARLDDLVASGLDHVQLSLQDSRAAEADAIAGIAAHQRKLTVAKLVTEAGLPLSINVVLHRHNVSRLAEIAQLAVDLGAERIELAHTQYYGWGLLNRAALLPDREQVARADEAAAGVIAANPGVEIVYVRPDYHDGVPKPCMNGWASTQLVVDPSGQVLPCPAATVIPDLQPLSVRAHSLSSIWYQSSPFNRFRGTSWMREPCRSCPRREIDFGGCRCQAFQLTGDASETDPACALSPRHAAVTAAVTEAATAAVTAEPVPLVPRRP